MYPLTCKWKVGEATVAISRRVSIHDTSFRHGSKDDYLYINVWMIFNTQNDPKPAFQKLGPHGAVIIEGEIKTNDCWGSVTRKGIAALNHPKHFVSYRVLNPPRLSTFRKCLSRRAKQDIGHLVKYHQISSKYCLWQFQCCKYQASQKAHVWLSFWRFVKKSATRFFTILDRHIRCRAEMPLCKIIVPPHLVAKSVSAVFSTSLSCAICSFKRSSLLLAFFLMAAWAFSISAFNLAFLSTTTGAADSSALATLGLLVKPNINPTKEAISTAANGGLEVSSGMSVCCICS